MGRGGVWWLYLLCVKDAMILSYLGCKDGQHNGCSTGVPTDQLARQSRIESHAYLYRSFPPISRLYKAILKYFSHMISGGWPNKVGGGTYVVCRSVRMLRIVSHVGNWEHLQFVSHPPPPHILGTWEGRIPYPWKVMRMSATWWPIRWRRELDGFCVRRVAGGGWMHA